MKRKGKHKRLVDAPVSLEMISMHVGGSTAAGDTR